jgi:PAS domain S-box-containing protein
MLYAIGRLRLLPRPLPVWAGTLLLFVAYVLPAGAMLLYAEHVVSARITEILYPLPWLADGIAVSLMLLWGTRTWPGVFVGSLLIWGVLRGDPPVIVTVDAIGETLSVVITVHLMRAWHFRRQLERLADPLILLAAALAGRAVAALADVVGCVAAVLLTPHGLPAEILSALTVPGTLTPAVTPALISVIARWQLNALAGIVLMIPPLLASPIRLRRALSERSARLAGLGVLSLLWCAVALELSRAEGSWLLLLAALLLVAWAAAEFGTLMAGLCTLAFACVAAVALCQGVGPLASADVLAGLTATWGFIGLLCCVSPILTVLLSARRHNDRRLRILAERYRSLFTANPTPVWVADPRGGGILMANVEAVRRYGYSEAEFLAMTMADLTAETSSHAELAPPEGKLVAAPLVRHRTREGRIIDVELVSTPLELDGRPVNLLYAVDMTDQQRLRRSLLAAADRESSRLSQKLDDGIGQLLSGISDGSGALLRRIEGAAVLEPTDLADLLELTHRAQQAESTLYQLTGTVSHADDPAGDAQTESARAAAAPAARGSDRETIAAVAAETARLPWFRRLALGLLTVAACWSGGAISYLLASAHNSGFTYADSSLAVPSLLTGVAVSAVLLGGPRLWLPVLIGTASFRFSLMAEPLPTALLFSAIYTAAACGIVALLRHWRFAPSLERWQDPLILSAAAALGWTVETLVSLAAGLFLASFGKEAMAPGVAALFACPDSSGACLTPAVLAAAVRWWVDGLAGIVLLVPTLKLPAAVRRAFRQTPGELAVWCLCLAGWGLMLLEVTNATILLPLLTLSVLLVLWGAARLGVALASLATLMCAMGAVAGFAMHRGAMGTQAAVAGVVYVWGFIGVLSALSLSLAVLLAEYHRRRREIRAVNQRYRSLFQGDPRPLWVHDARTGQILEANEPAARAYGYSVPEFVALNVARLLAPGTSHAALESPEDSAVGPLAMKNFRKSGDSMDVEVWSYGTFLDGRRVCVCFAHDVTERNTLRRLLFDRAELERRELGAELRRALSGPLAELRIVAHKLKLEVRRRGAPARMRELLESLARQAKRVAEHCGQVAHRLAPLQAAHGDLLAALRALQRRTPGSTPLEVSLAGDSPLALDQQQSEHLYSLLSEILAHCPAGSRGNVLVSLRSFGHTLRVAVDAKLQPPADVAPSLARHPSVLLRVRAMGARLWERSHTELVCDYPL